MVGHKDYNYIVIVGNLAYRQRSMYMLSLTKYRCFQKRQKKSLDWKGRQKLKMEK